MQMLVVIACLRSVKVTAMQQTNRIHIRKSNALQSFVTRAELNVASVLEYSE
jgi:hypothetical protein